MIWFRGRKNCQRISENRRIKRSRESGFSLTRYLLWCVYNLEKKRVGYMRFYDSEIKVLEVLWEHGELTARQIAEILGKEDGWKRTTAYTVVQKCVDKGYIERKKPKFTCKALITKEEAQMSSVSEQIEKSYPSKIAFFKAYLNKDNLTNDEIKGLFQVIDDLKK